MLFRAEEMIRSDVQIEINPVLPAEIAGLSTAEGLCRGEVVRAIDARATSNESLSRREASALSVPPGGTAATGITPCGGRATRSGEMSASNGNSSSRQEPNPAKNRQRLPLLLSPEVTPSLHVLRRFENWWLSTSPPGHILRPAPNLRRRPPP